MLPEQAAISANNQRLFWPKSGRSRFLQWKGNPKYQSYSDYQTVLIAPIQFLVRNQSQAANFDCFISHEEIADLIPLFGQTGNE